MTTLEAIELLKTYVFEENQDEEKLCFDLAIEALEKKAEREVPKQLSIEELKEMNEKPVYILFYSKTSKTGLWEGWAIADTRFCTMEFSEHNLDFKYYGKSWKAYKYKPKESVDGD